MDPVITSKKPIENQSVKDMATSIMEKLSCYSAHCSSTTVVPYLNADIQLKKKVGRKVTKTTEWYTNQCSIVTTFE